MKKNGSQKCHQQEKAYEMIEQFNTVERLTKHLKNSRAIGMLFFQNTFLKATMKNSTVWLIYGISTSVWLHSTCQEALHTLNPVSEEVWVSEIQQDLLGFVHQIPERAREGFLTWLQLSLKMAVRTISISLLPKKVTMKSEATSTMTRCG